MTVQARLGRSIRFAAVVVAGLALAACAQKAKDENLNGATVPGSAQDFVVNVGDRVFFETAKSSLSQQAQGVLASQATWLKLYPKYTVTIEGHADERGTREYNLALGARRANAARDYLIAQGVETFRVKTISYGKERPVSVCNDETCWSQNRRAVTVLSGAGS